MHKVDSITLQDLKEGSEKVLQFVYEDNRAKFLNFAKRYDLPQEDLVDIYQETYIAFYDNVMNGNITSFTSSISTYIISIGKYMIFDALKKKKKIVHPDMNSAFIQKRDEFTENFEIETNELTTEQQLLRAHFSSLGKKCKALLDLFYYRGFTIKDILEHTDYNSENVIKSAKSRCMKTLKERIFNAQQ